MNPLIDPATIRRFLTVLHAHAATAFNGVNRPGVVQLCTKFPDEQRMWASAFNIGDVDHMVEAAVIDAQAGKNVYCETRTTRDGRPGERGKAHADTRRVRPGRRP